MTDDTTHTGGTVDYPSPSWWRRALLRCAGFEPAAVWDCPDQPRVLYEDEDIPPGSMELWGRRLSKQERAPSGRPTLAEDYARAQEKYEQSGRSS